MPAQVCRLLMLALRSACRHPGSRPCMRRRPGSLGCGPKALTQRRAYSLDTLSSGSGRPPAQQAKGEKVSPSIALVQRNLSAVAASVQCRPQSRYELLDLGELEENTQRAKACKSKRRFIVEPAIAELVAYHLGPNLEDSKAAILECNPGPGVLTKTLLNAGAQRLVALESNKCFLPDLRALESRVDGQLEVVYCDFFTLNPLNIAHIRPPTMVTDELFTDLGISEAQWTDDVTVKVVGIIPQYKEKCLLWKKLYTLFQRSSVYRYGRVELNLFISEKDYLTMVAKPGNYWHYRPFGVLWQMACDIQLLHKEPWSSFATSSRYTSIQKSKVLPNDHLCLVRLTPRRDLFSSHLSPSNSSTMIMLVKQCLVKRKARLMDLLNTWSPDSGPKLLEQLGLAEDIVTGQVQPRQYQQLFELIEQSQEFAHSWILQEALDNGQRLSYI